MRKNSIAIISLAILASCFVASCSTEALEANQPVKGAKIVIPAQKMGTKALDPDGPDGKAIFNTSENVYIAQSGSVAANVLHPTDNAASTTFTGTFSGSLTDDITVLYNTNASGVVEYSGQDGSIVGVRDAGWAEDVQIVSYDENVLTTGSANIVNLQSIFKFTFTNGGAALENIRTVKIASANNKLVSAYDVITPTSTSTTLGPVTVSSASDLAVVYVALRFAEKDGTDVITFEVVDDAGKVYIGSNAAPSGGFENGKFYTKSISVTPTSKLAFRGYEVSTGILKRTGNPATYSLTSGEMIRDIATMTYSLPAGCNPFEPSLVAYHTNEYFLKWETLNGDDASSKLPEGWQFPSAGGSYNNTSNPTAWGKILFGYPETPITVDTGTETLTFSKAANRGYAFAMVTVNLEANNKYTGTAGTFYGILLLRDGTHIPTGYLDSFKNQSVSRSYSENSLTQSQFEDLIEMGCLFIPATGTSTSFDYRLIYSSNSMYNSYFYYILNFNSSNNPQPDGVSDVQANNKNIATKAGSFVFKLVKQL